MRKRMGLVLFAALFAGVALTGVACKPKSAEAPTSSALDQKSLYVRLGGGAGIKAVVDEFVTNVAADTRINHFFQDTDLGSLRMNFANLIGQAAGGPEKYTGRDMKTVHNGMGIAEADFNALIEDLTRALDKFKVADREKGELIALLSGMKGEIVEK